MTFLQKFYFEYTKVEQPVVVTTSYEGLDKEEELKTVTVVINNNSINNVSDFDVTQVKNSSKMMMKTFWRRHQGLSQSNLSNHYQCILVWAMKKLQALYNDNANKVVEASNMRKKCHRKFKFPHQFGYGNKQHQACTWRAQDLHQKTGTIPMQVLKENEEKQSKRNLPVLASNKYGEKQV